MKSDHVLCWIACAVILANTLGIYSVSITTEAFAQQNNTDLLADYNNTTNATNVFGKNDSDLGSGNISGLLFGIG